LNQGTIHIYLAELRWSDCSGKRPSLRHEVQIAIKSAFIPEQFEAHSPASFPDIPGFIAEEVGIQMLIDSVRHYIAKFP
jgi:hypothetical protein